RTCSRARRHANSSPVQEARSLRSRLNGGTWTSSPPPPTPNLRPRRFAMPRFLPRITRRRVLLSLGSLLLLTGTLVGGGWLYVRHVLTTSLPLLDGDVRVDGLAAPVRVERDGHGIPTIRAANRDDALFALGFVHAQDRFFQMDGTRRFAAGELSELFGP